MIGIPLGGGPGLLGGKNTETTPFRKIEKTF
ncbi:hypothetical protein P378_05360 [Desulforamulus profundi]|uniref:Uncharacterized protein n=1 Tax=Desulforamulus profundi TaxID=1383067 RepID=A0A2C6MI68_9FIRM|nr:hypothetical protein P378_05360 [Desulforamulus profundi]